MTTVTNISAGQMVRTANRMSRHMDALACNVRLMTPPAPDVLADIEDADCLHETACDGYDIATRELDAARDALTEAARRLTDAEDAWQRAGAEMHDAALHVSRLRQAAGVRLTAAGYQAVTS